MTEGALGCKICSKGAKLVLFITGICRRRCFYCPISKEKRGKDLIFANERRVVDDEEVIEEAARMSALGTGITGGEPLLFLDRTLHFMDLLKGEFGESHHIHLYATEKLSRGSAEELYSHGLDEIRFHPIGRVSSYVDSLRSAREAGISVGVELPAIPGWEGRIGEVIEKLDPDFLNLNELEFSETNQKPLSSRGFKTSNGIRAKGSRELAIGIVRDYDERIPINFCSADFKDGVQLRNRLLRTAHNVSKEYECVTSDGTILRGLLELDDLDLNSMAKLLKMLKYRNYDLEEGRILTDPETVIRILGRLPVGVKAYISEVYPTWDEIEVEREVLKDWSIRRPPPRR
jgi:hypothetical protein